MATDIVTPNIFKTRNDWNVIALKCVKYDPKDFFVSRIAKIIKDETGIDPFLKVGLRDREYVEARQLFATIMHRNTKKTLSAIGKPVCKNYATILHSCKAVQNRYDTDKQFRVIYDKIDLKIKSLNN